MYFPFSGESTRLRFFKILSLAITLLTFSPMCSATSLHLAVFPISAKALKNLNIYFIKFFSLEPHFLAILYNLSLKLLKSIPRGPTDWAPLWYFALHSISAYLAYIDFIKWCIFSRIYEFFRLLIELCMLLLAL